MTISREAYTKIFLKSEGIDATTETVEAKMRILWKNNRRGSKSLRLTDAGFLYVSESLDLIIHEVPFPEELDLKPDVLLYMDRFIDCPYYITDKSIHLLGERKALELHLFSGDVRRYGLIKAKNRKLPKLLY